MIHWYIPPGLDVDLLTEELSSKLLLVSCPDEADYLASRDIPAFAFPTITQTLPEEGIQELCETLPLSACGDAYIYVSADAPNKYHTLQFRDHVAIYLSEKELARVYLLPEGRESLQSLCARQSVLGFYQYLEKFSPLNEHAVCSLRLNDEFLRFKGTFTAISIKTGRKHDKRSFRAACVHLIPPYVYRPGMVVYHWWMNSWARTCAGYGTYPDKPYPLYNKDGHIYINRWRPPDCPDHVEEAEIAPFKALLHAVFNENRDDSVEFFLKCLAYKMQNPSCRIPYAFIFLGRQGTGKSLVCNILVQAFAPHSGYYNDDRMQVPAQYLAGKYLSVFDEFPPSSLTKYIHNTRRVLTERWLYNAPGRGYGNVALWLFTSNNAYVGDIVKDERRFVAIRSDTPLDPDLYAQVAEWQGSNGARKLTRYFLDMDITGFEIPGFPPMTSESAFNQAHSMDIISSFVYQMKTSTVNPLKIWIKDLYNILKLDLCSPSLKRRNTAKQILLNLATVRVRPLLTVKELDTVLRNYLLVRYRKRWGEITPGELVHKLRVKGMRTLVNPANIQGFEWQGVYSHYLIIHDASVPDNVVSQEQFEALMQSGDIAIESADIEELVRNSNKI